MQAILKEQADVPNTYEDADINISCSACNNKTFASKTVYELWAHGNISIICKCGIRLFEIKRG